MEDTTKSLDTYESLMGRVHELILEDENLEALYCVEKARRMEDTPEARSYFGMLITLERGQWREGLDLCREALSHAPEDPCMFLNQAKALYHTGQKREGIEAARHACGLGDCPEAPAWLAKLGIRRPLMFPFLDRSHPFNKYLGLALKHLDLG